MKVCSSEKPINSASTQHLSRPNAWLFSSDMRALLQDLAVCFPQPGIFLTSLHSCEFPGGGLVIRPHSFFCVFLLPFMQKMVINKARMSELNSQAFGLLRGWIQAEFIGFSDEHTLILALMFYPGKVISIYGKDLFTFSSPQQDAGMKR